MKSQKKPQSMLEVIREVAMTTGGSSAAVKAALEARLGAGFLQGIELLGAYAQQDLQDDETAIDAESQAVALSRQVVRPLLEKRLQRAVDKVDQSTAKKKRRRAPAAS
jgi:hypothetical protein